MRGVILLILIVVTGACLNLKVNKSEIEVLLKAGEFAKAEAILKRNIEKSPWQEKQAHQIQLETIDRIRKEFPYYRRDIEKQLEKYFPNISDAQLDEWEAAKQLEMRVIDGEKRYFKRSVSNLFRLNTEAKKLKESVDGKRISGSEKFQQTAIPGYFGNGLQPGKSFDSRTIKVNYTITLKANAVSAGEMVRCWLPYPRINRERLPEVTLIDASQEEYIIAPEETMQRTVYMEKQAVNNEETVFNVSYSFKSVAQWFDVKPEQARPYKKSTEFYKKFTAERLPNITFSKRISSTAKQIVGAETNPVKQVELLFYWIDKNIPWAGALEYSTMDCIPKYVLENGHGDCGMKTFLLLSMTRSLGIPCKWQSGWYLLPEEKNLHDWAEVYYEGIGWVPVDPSFGLIDSEDQRVKKFYLNGLDSYRLIINDDYSQELYPPKKHYRSEPYDFQRGELEWDGGNLYFDSWSYKMQVEYLD
ncbi:transglutaminase-like domain-containing protein [Prolixibacteraceae bacterium Z1-6]|uniref:Transglutaminase-like domain-containing protein n=1 Tax=Draconibacterium aestuarii TaxID=2998507 RepID=A0A9X3J6B5_9BACT|nr:transglutaminase-like domain-containing protein [Prolixibacteraceae bacterium Z1-6]